MWRIRTLRQVGITARYRYENVRAFATPGSLRPHVDRHQLPSREVGTLLHTIDLNSLWSDNPGDALVNISDVETLASYNLSSEKSLIQVPGSLPRWNPPKLPYKLGSKDIIQDPEPATNVYKREQQDSIFQVLHCMKPDYDMSSIDIVTSARHLGLLLTSLIYSSGYKPKYLRVEVVENTMFLSEVLLRRPLQPDTKAGRKQLKTSQATEYGLTTYDQYFAKDQFHVRMMKYKFAGLNFIVTSQVDAYLEPTTSQNELPPQSSTISLNPTAESPNLEPIRHESLDPRNEALDIKMRYGKPVEKIIPGNFSQREQLEMQAFFSHITKFYYCHVDSNGWLAKIQKEDLRRNRQWFVNKRQRELKLLIRVLKELREIAKGTNNQSCLAFIDRRSGGKIGVYASSIPKETTGDDSDGKGNVSKWSKLMSRD